MYYISMIKKVVNDLVDLYNSQQKHEIIQHKKSI